MRRTGSIQGRAPGLLGSAHPNVGPHHDKSSMRATAVLGVVNDHRLPANSRPRRGRTSRRTCASSSCETDREPRAAADPAQGVPRTRWSRYTGPDARGRSPRAPSHRVPQAFAQAHAAHRGMAVDSACRRCRHPPQAFTDARHPTRKPPRFGEHADQVLAEAGYTRDQIAELRRKDIVRERPLKP